MNPDLNPTTQPGQPTPSAEEADRLRDQAAAANGGGEQPPQEDAAPDAAAADEPQAAPPAADEPAGENEAVEEPEEEQAAEADSEAPAAAPLELVEEPVVGEDLQPNWYILKVQVNREESIRDALIRRVKIEGLEDFFGDIVVPTEDVVEFTKTGKRRIVKRKLYPGYIMVNMVINDDTWFLVRETPGIGDFTGSAGKPTPMDTREVERILRTETEEDEETPMKTSIPFSIGDRVRVKEGNFLNFEGDVDKIDETHGLITVVIPIFNRPTPVEIPYWQIEKV